MPIEEPVEDFCDAVLREQGRVLVVPIPFSPAGTG